MAKRYSVGFNRDWDFYVANISEGENYAPVIPETIHEHGDIKDNCVPKVISKADGVNAKEAFQVLDSTGIAEPTCEPELLRDVLLSKASINFLVKQWAEGWLDMREPMETYLSELVSPPEWVKDALQRMVWKTHYQKPMKIHDRAYMEYYDMYMSGRREDSYPENEPEMPPSFSYGGWIFPEKSKGTS